MMNMTMNNPKDKNTKQKRRNRALLAMLVGMVALFYAVSIVRMGLIE